ncbi:spinster family MFS transporter [Blastomonas fulva]|uniref:spinster family MFS transporter n=1 Tax=Blastomonas fulva TaxID=1550728 RepID=UPI003F70EE2C
MSAQARTTSVKRANMALLVLLVAYTFSFIDRTILALLVQPIQRDFAIGDTEISLLHGLAFALFYTFLGIPIARLADRHSRRGIVAIGIAIWSIATAMCALTRNFAHLFVARVMVGVGEAALSPAAYSLITDIFPRRRLGTALAVYQVGLYLGAGLAFIIGGVVVALAMRADTVTIPVFGELRSWQLVFVLVGLPGLIVALLALTLPEPRGRSATSDKIERDLPTIRQVMATMQKQWKVYGGHFLGFSVTGLVFNGYLAWLPTLFVRKYGWQQSDVGLWLGAVILVFGATGIVAGGVVADRFLSRNRKDGAIRSGMLGSALLIPFAVGAPLMSDGIDAMVCLCGFFFFSSFPYAGAATAIQIVSPPAMRAQASAAFLFCLNLIGIGLGPTIVALFTDMLFQDASAIDYSLVLTAGLFGPIGAGVLFLTMRPYARLASSLESQQTLP